MWVRLSIFFALFASAATFGTPLCETKKLVAPAERFTDTLRLLVVEKGKLDDESLLAIAKSSTPLNPIDEAVVGLGRIERHVYQKAFAALIAEGIGPAEWPAIQTAARGLYEARHGVRAIREEAVVGSQGIVTLRPISSATLLPHTTVGRGGASIEFASARAGDGSIYFTYAGADAVIPRLYGQVDLQGQVRQAGNARREIDPVKTGHGFIVPGENGKMQGIGITWSNHLVITDVASGAEINRVQIPHKSNIYDAVPFVDGEGRPRIVFTGGGKQWLFDPQKKSWRPVPYKNGLTKFHLSPENGTAYASAVRPGDRSMWDKLRRHDNGLVFSVTDLVSGKELLNEPLGTQANGALSDGGYATIVHKKSDGSVLAATRYRTKIYIFDSATKERFEIDDPREAETRPEPFLGFRETSEGWIFLAEINGSSVPGMRLRDRKPMTLDLSDAVKNEVGFLVGGKAGRLQLLAHRRKDPGSSKRTFESIDVLSGTRTQLPDPGMMLGIYERPEGTFALFHQGAKFSYVRLFGAAN